jgi:TP901 family phage tail tape measure protein
MSATDRNLRLQVLLSAIDKVTAPMRRITAGSADAAKQIKAARDKLKELNAQQAVVDKFRALQAGAKETAEKLRVMRQALDQARTAHAQDAEAAKAQAREVAAGERAVAKLTKAYEKQFAALRPLRERMKLQGIDNVAQAESRLKTETEQANAAIDEQKAKLAALSAAQKRHKAVQAAYSKRLKSSDELGSAGTKIMAVGATAAAAGAIPVYAYAKAEDSATQLRIALMKKGGEVSAEFAAINALAEKLGNTLPGATSDFQDMMTMLIRQGMQAKAILGGLGEATAYLAVQLKMAPPDAAEFASKLQDATRTADVDMMKLMDTIQKAYYLGVDPNNMQEGFAKLSPALSTLRKEGAAAAAELAPLLVMADQAAMRGEAAGNAYRKIFQMALDAKKIEKGMKELKGTGITLDFTDGKGEFGGLQNMFAQLAKLKGLDTQRRQSVIKTIFGDDAETMQALALMIDKGAAGYAEVQAKMQAQADLQIRVNEQLKTLKNLWDAASGTFTNALVAFGESISPDLHATAVWLGKVAEGTQAWARANPELSAALMTTLKWVAALALGLGGLAMVTAGGMATWAFLARYLAWLPGLLGVLAAAFPAVTAAMSVAVPILTALAVASAAGYLAGKLLASGLDAALSSLLGYKTTLGSSLYDLVQWVKNQFSTLMTWLTGLPARFVDAGSAMIQGLVSGITARWESLRNAVTGVADATVKWFKEKLGIHSPSRVFIAAGGEISAGAALGIRGRTGEVLKAAMGMADVANSLLPQFSAAGAIRIDSRPAITAAPPRSSPAPAAAGGNHFHIYPAPGMDERALARLVAQEMDKRDSASRARRRSALNDID